jgi:ATP-dependent protease ClpP protease subunit
MTIRNRGTGVPPAGYRMAKNGKRGEIYLYGVIGASWFGDGITAKQFSDDLKALKGVDGIDLRINSEGGDVFDGKAMYTLLRDHGAEITVHIDGLAASAASYIAMAGDDIRISEAGFMMVHNAWGGAVGNAEELRRLASLLDTIDGTIRDVYAARTGLPAETVAELMAAETWMTAAEAKEKGFADTVVENLKIAAFVRDDFRYRNTPAALRPRRVAAVARLEAMRAP